MSEKLYESKTLRGAVMGAVGVAAIVASCDGPEASPHEKITKVIECDEGVSFDLTDDNALEVLGFTDKRHNGKEGYADILVSHIDGGIYTGVEALSSVPKQAIDRSDPANFDISADSTRGMAVAPHDGVYEATPTVPVLGGEKDKDIQANFAVKGDVKEQEVYVEIDCDRQR